MCGYPGCGPEAVGLRYRGGLTHWLMHAGFHVASMFLFLVLHSTNTVKPFRSDSVCQALQAFARDSYISPHNSERSCYFAGKITDVEPKPVDFINPPFAHRGPAVHLNYLIYMCLLLRLRSSLRITTEITPSKLGDMSSMLTLLMRKRWGIKDSARFSVHREAQFRNVDLSVWAQETYLNN